MKDIKEELGIVGGIIITVTGVIFNNSTAVLGGIGIVAGISGVKLYRGDGGL